MFVVIVLLCPQQTAARGQCGSDGAAECWNGVPAAPCWYGGLQTLHSGLAGGDTTTWNWGEGAREQEEEQRGTKHKNHLSIVNNKDSVAEECHNNLCWVRPPSEIPKTRSLSGVLTIQKHSNPPLCLTDSRERPPQTSQMPGGWEAPPIYLWGTSAGVSQHPIGGAGSLLPITEGRALFSKRLLTCFISSKSPVSLWPLPSHL